MTYNDAHIFSYTQLFDFLTANFTSRSDFLDWLNTPWVSKNKLEACFRLFSILGMHPFQDKYALCTGNFNKGQIRKCTNDDIQKLLSVNIKDKGDISDQTFETEDFILVFTIKDWCKNHIGKLDIGDILLYSKKYSKPIQIGFCVRDNVKFTEMIRKTNSSSDAQTVWAEKAVRSCLVFDYEYIADLFVYLPDTLPDKITHAFIPYFHQELCFLKIKHAFTRTSSVILNALPRSGKTQIIGMCIRRLNEICPDSQTRTVLMITLRPAETLTAYKDFFTGYISEYNIMFLSDTKGKQPDTTQNTIFICSKQFLQTKTGHARKIHWLEQTYFDMVFIDEPHDGGSTQLASDVYNVYGKTFKTVFVTATCAPSKNP